MQFFVKPQIVDAPSLGEFMAGWQVGKGDLIVTNKYLITPYIKEADIPCDVIYQEEYGKGEPTDQMTDAMLQSIKGKDIRRIIAIGGGTVIDIAKLFVFGDGLTSGEIFSAGAALERRRKLVILPTTCGTGSEVTGISILGFVKENTKKGLALPALYADEAVLIPEMLQSLPYDVFATSSIDALIHAVESLVSPKSNSFTRSFSRTAIELILEGYAEIAQQGSRSLPGCMRGYLEASTMAGAAFANAGCAAVHALSYPIGGEYHVAHGKANYMVFKGVFDAYIKKGADISALNKILADVLGCEEGGELQSLFDLLGRVYDNQPLGELGVDAEKCAGMAASVVKNQQRLLANTPVELDEKDIREIYLNCI